MNTDRRLTEFLNGSYDKAYEYFGCHKSKKGFVFRVYAPKAKSVRLVGGFNGWNTEVPPMKDIGGGVWEENIGIASVYDEYKYYIEGADGKYVYKTDPYGSHFGTRPDNSSKVFPLEGFGWSDGKYMEARKKYEPIKNPINIYELHLGSWRKHPDGNFFTYRETADDLVKYLTEMGYTHVELLPVSEHPLDASWGYQATGYFAPTSRYGTPHDFMYFVDKCHSAGIGVILDWVGAHFPKDEFGLSSFDGDFLYESADETRREHPEWGTRNFDYGRNEVRSFLISSVCFWLNVYHIDGIRVDAVSSMVYIDYGRQDGEWHPNSDGGNINYDAVALLRDINSAAFKNASGIIMAAEESTAFPMVTKPGYDGGLGFNFKWNMGWMHDTLDYMSQDPIMRKGMHDRLTFSMTYAFSENFILPLSHDEVVHGKRSIIGRMPGEYEDKFPNMRTMMGYMAAHPGKKLSFMGNEFAQFIEWNFGIELDWFLLSYDRHRQMSDYIKALNHFYLDNKEFWENECDWNGFQWIKPDDRDNGIIAFRRIANNGDEVICVFNFCPVERRNYRIGVPYKCVLKPVFSSDDIRFGGRGTELQRVKADKTEWDGCRYSASLRVPAMSAVFYRMIYIKK